jgi:hypothetical protein
MKTRIVAALFIFLAIERRAVHEDESMALTEGK